MKKINARTKGHSFERQIRKELIELGWKDCVTSRYGSKEMDDALVDLLNTPPFNFQLKALERAPSYHEILSQMPQDTNMNIIIHKRNRKGEVVTMWKEDFYFLIGLLKLQSLLPQVHRVAKDA